MGSPGRPPVLQPGQILDHHEILDLLGRGGMGEVYRARQLSMDRLVALKLLAPRLAADPAFTDRFIAEARAAGRLNHPHVLHVHDVGQAPLPDGSTGFYFTMELIEGESVQDLLDRQGALDDALVSNVMRGAAAALGYAAGQGMVHRDVKPDNLLIARATGEVKLADLGLATSIDEQVVERDAKGRVKVFGTPRYMAPEQARGLPLDHRADQYALGATLFHLLTGRPPFDGTDGKQVMRAHVHEPVPDPAEVRPEVPEAWRQLTQRLMAKTPEGRFATPDALQAAVAAASQGITLDDLEAESRRLPLALALVGGAVLLGGLLWLLATPSAPRAPGPTVNVPTR